METTKHSDGTACPVCEQKSLSEKMGSEKFPFGVENRIMLEAVIPILTCDACGFEFTDSRAEEIRHLVACGHQNLLTHGEASLSRLENCSVFHCPYCEGKPAEPMLPKQTSVTTLVERLRDLDVTCDSPLYGVHLLAADELESQAVKIERLKRLATRIV